jgi:hypothetical protein
MYLASVNSWEANGGVVTFLDLDLPMRPPEPRVISRAEGGWLDTTNYRSCPVAVRQIRDRQTLEKFKRWEAWWETVGDSCEGVGVVIDNYRIIRVNYPTHDWISRGWRTAVIKRRQEDEFAAMTYYPERPNFNPIPTVLRVDQGGQWADIGGMSCPVVVELKPNRAAGARLLRCVREWEQRFRI